MVVTIDTADPRSVRALAVLKTADRWVRGTRRNDGREFFIIPASTSGAVYYADERNCTCPDSGRRLTVCKHSRVVQLYRLQTGQVEPAPAPTRGACRGCGAELPAGLISGLCDDCNADMAFLTVLGPTAARPVVQMIGA